MLQRLHPLKHTRRFFGAWRVLILVIVCLSLPVCRAGTAELIVRYRARAAPLSVAKARREAGLRVKERVRTRAMEKSNHPGLELVESELDLHAALAILRRNPAVERAEPNYILHSTAASNDPYFGSGQLWGMYGDHSNPANAFGSQAAEGWAAGYTGSSSVCVAVLDDGVDISHPDLAPNIWQNPFDPVDGIDNDGNGLVDDVNGWNFFAGSSAVYEANNYHGTHVAGTIGARGGNGAGVAGVSWNVTLIPVKFISDRNGTTLNAIKAIDYCIDLKNRHGLNLVAMNASWGGEGYAAELHDAIIRAAKAGILFVAAAGNDAADNDATFFAPANIDTRIGTLTENPASYNSVISVAAIDALGGLASFSNFGARKVHLGAPGNDIVSTLPGGLYGSMGGTSMAAPHVTGAAALYASTHAGASAEQIRAAILESVQPTAGLAGKTATGGRLDLSAVIAPAPVLAGVSAVIMSESNANGTADPGEVLTVRLTVTNCARFGTASLAGVLEASGGVMNPSAAQSFGALAGGSAVAARDFTFTAGGTCGEELVLALHLSDGATNLGTLSFRLQLGSAVTVFSEDLAGATPPALPNGWSAALAGQGAAWKTVWVDGGRALFSPNASGVADNQLTSPAIHVRSGSAVLTFEQSFVLEPDWDGGVLEISIAGGPYTDFLAAGGRFLANGYNWRLNDETTPLAASEAWSGNSGGRLVTRAQLPGSCYNEDVRLRWRCGSDTAFGGSGWYLYSVQIDDGYACLLPDVSTLEDAPPVTAPFSIGTADAEPGLSLTVSSTNEMLLPASTITLGGAGANRWATLSPATNQNGSSAITLKVESAVATTYRTFNFLVTPVNDPPAFVRGANLTVAQESAAQNFPGWASAIVPGPADEAGQALSFELQADAPQLFAAGPVISSDGALSFTAAKNARGVATVSVFLKDDGGGLDRSEAQVFSITVGEGADSDGDGLPDDYEAAFGFQGNVADGGEDADGDSASNYEEFLAATDPLDPQSTLRMNGFSAGALRFPSVTGRVYAVEERVSLDSGAWAERVSGQAGTGSVLTITEAQGLTVGTQGVYRVTTRGENGNVVSSDSAGYLRVDLAGGSDTYVSLPFVRPAAESGKVESVTGNTVRWSGSPGWTPAKWIYSAATQTNTYYLFVRSGVLEGEYFTVTANSADTLELEADDGELAGLAQGDAVGIVPYWTLGSIFPEGTNVDSSAAPGVRATEVLVPDVQSAGTNLSASAIYYFWNHAWRRVGQGSGSRNDDVLLPDMHFIVRQNGGSSRSLFLAGMVESRKIRMRLRREIAAGQDNSLALRRPVSVSLDTSGLAGSGFEASSAAGFYGDELIVFSNAEAGKNRSASAIYYFLDGAWRRVGGGGADAGADLVFSPGAGFIIRTAAGPGSGRWLNAPSY